MLLTVKKIFQLVINVFRLQTYRSFSSEQLISFIKQWVLANVKYEYQMSIYLIGSLAYGGYVHGKSDCDVLVVRPNGCSKYIVSKLFISNLCPTPLNILSKIISLPRNLLVEVTCTIRPIQLLADPFKALRCDLNKRKCWKDLTVVEDLMMLLDHGELIHGSEIRNKLTLPTKEDVRRYYIWRTRILREKIFSEEADGSTNVERLVKSIIKHARECYFLWVGDTCFSTDVLFHKFREKLPNFPGLDILREALYVREKSLRKMPQAVTDEVRIDGMKKKRAKFFKLCHEYDKLFLRKINSKQEAIAATIFKKGANKVLEKRVWTEIKYEGI